MVVINPAFEQKGPVGFTGLVIEPNRTHPKILPIEHLKYQHNRTFENQALQQ